MKKFKKLINELDEAMSDAKLKSLKKQYDKNEDQNRHTENYLLLAKAFGTRVEIKKVQEIIKRKDKEGISKTDSDWMYKNINSYFRKLDEAKESVDELDEAKKSKSPIAKKKGDEVEHNIKVTFIKGKGWGIRVYANGKLSAQAVVDDRSKISSKITSMMRDEDKFFGNSSKMAHTSRMRPGKKNKSYSRGPETVGSAAKPLRGSR